MLIKSLEITIADMELFHKRSEAGIKMKYEMLMHRSKDSFAHKDSYPLRSSNTSINDNNDMTKKKKKVSKFKKSNVN